MLLKTDIIKKIIEYHVSMFSVVCRPNFVPFLINIRGAVINCPLLKKLEARVPIRCGRGPGFEVVGSP
jgi:hypothetical protein